MILLIDNFDSFTYNLRDLILQQGKEVNCHRVNEIPEVLQNMSAIEGIVISPGPSKPDDYPELNVIMDTYIGKKPILGICLGFQLIGQYFGADVNHAPEPKHGKISTVRHEKHLMFDGVPSPFEVTRYHSLCLSSLPDELEKTAESQDDGLIMALAHKRLAIWGYQFHPEAVLTKDGVRLMSNWVKSLN